MENLSTWIFTVIMALANPEKVAKHSTESVEEMTARYHSIAEDMANVIETSEPVFKSDNHKFKTAAVLSALALYESGFRKSVDNGEVRGDDGRSWCLMQINIGKGNVPVGTDEMKKWKGKDLVEDRKKCFKVGLEMARRSINSCAVNPLSVYGSGECLKKEPKSRKRWDAAMRILDRHPFKKSQELKDTKEEPKKSK
jgi:hypothetical protein